MLPDVQGLMLNRDGVGPDLIRAGEPRLVSRRTRRREAPQAAKAARRVLLLRKALRPATS